MADLSKPYVVTIVGPESSGKTTLTRQLAAALECPHVDEYARQYIDDLRRPYDQDDLEQIAHGQLRAIHHALSEVRKDFSEQEFVDAFGKVFGHAEESRTPDSVLLIPFSAFGDTRRKIIIVDNGLLSIRLWAGLKYGFTIPMVEEALQEGMTDLYVLCRPVIPWEDDPQREAPALLDRVWIYNQFLDYLIRQQQKSISA